MRTTKSEVRWAISSVILVVIIPLTITPSVYKYVPPLLIPYTSTIVNSLRQVVEFEQEWFSFEHELVAMKSEFDNLESFVNNNLHNLTIKLNELTIEMRKYMGSIDLYRDEDYANVKVKVEQFAAMQRNLTKITEATHNMSFWMTELYSKGSDYQMWVFDQHIKFLATQGIELDTASGEEAIAIVSKIPDIMDKTIQPLDYATLFLSMLLQTAEPYEKSKNMFSALKETYCQSKCGPLENLELDWAAQFEHLKLEEVIKKLTKFPQSSPVIRTLLYFTEIRRTNVLMLGIEIMRKGKLLGEAYKNWTNQMIEVEDLVNLMEQFEKNMDLRKAVNLDEKVEL